MPITRRPNGSYQVTVCYGGRTHRKSSRHWTRAAARAFEAHWLAEIRDAASGRPPVRSIADALERWLIEHVPRLRSARQTRNHARRLLPYIAGRALTDAPQVWAQIKVASAGKAPATVNHQGRILRQLCRMAWREWGWLPQPVTISLLPEAPRESFLTREQVEALAQACPSPETGDYIRLAAYTGIRRGHLLRLTHHDIEGEFLRLDRSSKTKVLQWVPLHPRVQAIAERLPLGVGSARLQAEWTTARQATGIDCRWHDLRHTCASWLVQAGVPLYTVAQFLGHSSTTVTQRYAHLAPQHLADAVRKLA